MEDNKLYEKNMRKIFFLDLAIENYEDNTGKNIKNLEKTFNELKHLRKENEKMNNEEKIELKQEIREFFLQEINALEEAKKILKGEVNISENEKTKKLKAIFIPREYLYLHFPDGYKFSLDLSFLKRVRAEMDFFLKEFKTDLTLLDD